MRIGLLTCVGSLASPSNIRCIREITDRIIGTDLLTDAVGRQFVDEFIPSCTAELLSDKYFPNLSSKHEYYVFICSDEEAIHLSKYIGMFGNVNILLTGHENLVRAFDKLEFYKTLKECGIDYPKYVPVSNVEEIEKACYALDYPNKKVIVKPAFGRGGRGVYVIDSEVALGFSEKPRFHFPLDGFCNLISKKYTQPHSSIDRRNESLILVSEYLDGQPWSVDFVAFQGNLICAVPKLKAQGDNYTTTHAVIKENKNIISIISKIVKNYNYSYIGNIEFIERQNGELVPFDFNARVASSSGSVSAAGVNLFQAAIELSKTGTTSVSQSDVEYEINIFKYLSEIRT